MLVEVKDQLEAAKAKVVIEELVSKLYYIKTNFKCDG
mgnify:FL=1